MSSTITIGFNFENEFGHKYTSNSQVEVFSELGDTELDIIGEQLNCFLKQCGYVRTNDYILMADLTEEEHYALTDYLEELRDKEGGGGE